MNLLSKILSFDINIPLPHIVLPLALSFITFQQIAFLVDCYKSKIEDSSFLDYCLFISFFPQLIAGPIVHHKEMIPQFKAQHSICWENIAKGLFIFSIGLFKKSCIADTLGEYADKGFNALQSGLRLNFFESWATSLSYSLELYFDFSGYCDMAIGLGLLFGIVLPINFNSPYKALNISEFWRKWHITLGRFLRDYVYIPLGGSKNLHIQNHAHSLFLNQLFTLRNCFIVAFLSGVWHGAGWGFIIWGCIHALGLICHKSYIFLFHKYLMTLRENRLYKALCYFLTFNFINIAWVFFRSESVHAALLCLKGMFMGDIILPSIFKAKLEPFFGFVSFDKWAVAMEESMYIVYAHIIIAFMLCLMCKNSQYLTSHLKPNYCNFVFMCFLMIASLLTLDKTSQFLYFNF